jgi:hypothetical protein
VKTTTKTIQLLLALTLLSCAKKGVQTPAQPKIKWPPAAECSADLASSFSVESVEEAFRQSQFHPNYKTTDLTETCCQQRVYEYNQNQGSKQYLYHCCNLLGRPEGAACRP